MALALTVYTHTTDGNQSLCSITSAQVQSDLGGAQEEFHVLAVHLQELALNHTIFDESAFLEEAMDDWASLGSLQSQKMPQLYKEKRNNSMHLCLCINEIEQSSLMPVKNPGVLPPNSGSTAPSPPVVHISRTDRISGAVQGLKQIIIPLFWVTTGGMIKAQPNFLVIMVLMG
jgi:hypothetical protein